MAKTDLVDKDWRVIKDALKSHIDSLNRQMNQGNKNDLIKQVYETSAKDAKSVLEKIT